jgi:hypothetical protein
MAVLVEAISVIILRQSIDEKYPGGWSSFVDKVPNKTLCFDSHLARVGFMVPQDVQKYVEFLQSQGLRFLSDGNFMDIAIVDQLGGLTRPCEWLEFTQIVLGASGSKIAICGLLGSDQREFFTPEGWEFENSLSKTHGFVPNERIDENLRFLRRDNGVDVYWDISQGREVYIGRTTD